jgi:Na+/proline symporter
MLAARSERDALAGALFFNVAHYALRPWPWIIVALASLIVFPQLTDISAAFPWVDPGLVGHDMAYSAMLSFLPAGFLGLMVAGLLSAYISTVSTHLNWGTSYLVHDVYRRFVRSDAPERHYVLMGRVVTGALMVIAALFSTVLNSARESFDLMLSVGAGTGLLYLLRWFWWRVNAWSEISAMVGSFLIAAGFFVARKMGADIPSHVALLTGVFATTVTWISVTLLTQPVSQEKLVSFYKLVRPAGPGWRDIRVMAGVGASPDSISQSILGWVLGCLLVYSALFGTGSVLYGNGAQAAMWIAIFVASAVGLFRIVRSLWRG